MNEEWLSSERTKLAAERILDAAERVFSVRGVAATEMTHLAREAGCSRATLYRYFESKNEVRLAYMHRQTRRIAHDVSEQIQHVADDQRRLIEAITATLREVRARPALATWFSQPDSGLTAELAGSSQVLLTVCAAFLGDPADPDVQTRASWLLRVIVSLLSAPADDDTEERSMIERFAAPVLLSEPTRWRGR